MDQRLASASTGSNRKNWVISDIRLSKAGSVSDAQTVLWVALACLNVDLSAFSRVRAVGQGAIPRFVLVGALSEGHRADRAQAPPPPGLVRGRVASVTPS